MVNGGGKNEVIQRHGKQRNFNRSRTASRIWDTKSGSIRRTTTNTLRLYKHAFRYDLWKTFLYIRQKLRDAGVWGCGIDGVIDAVIISENQLYYLHNLKPIEAYNKYFKGVEGFESEKTRAEKRLAIAENMRQYATVINCYID